MLESIVEFFVKIEPALPNIFSAAGTILSAIVAFLVYRFDRNYRSAAILEQSFNALQRINEAALRSDENVIAALKSVNQSDDLSPNEARIAYFNYLRINRLYRAYEYWRCKLISEKTRQRIVRSHIASLYEAQPYLDALLQRGYPNDFHEYLKSELKNVTAAPDPIPPIIRKIDISSELNS